MNVGRLKCVASAPGMRGVPIVSSDQHGVGLSRSRFCREGSGAPKLASIERRVAVASSPPVSELGKKVAAAMAPWQDKVKAEQDYAVAKEKCETLGSDAQKACKDQAEASYESAKAQAQATLDAAKRSGSAEPTPTPGN